MKLKYVVYWIAAYGDPETRYRGVEVTDGQSGVNW